MTLLIPELERHLRAVVEEQLHPRRRRLLRPGVIMPAVAAVAALAIAAIAVVLVGHRRSSVGVAARPSQVMIEQSGCGALLRGVALPARFPEVASGSAEGRPWKLYASRAAPHAIVGEFVLSGHAYGFCGAGADFHLINVRPHGIVYGFVSGPGRYVIHAARAEIRQLPSGTFFVLVLPRPACRYKSLTVSATARIQSNREITDTIVQAFGTCRPGELVQEKSSSGKELGQGSPNAIPVSRPPGRSAAARAAFDKGRTVAGQAGCLACHRIAGAGNNGPGPDLTNIGRNLSPAALRGSLLHPRAPMPSFRGLPPAALRNLVAFLSDLRGQK
jgi:hypothetical protein